MVCLSLEVMYCSLKWIYRVLDMLIGEPDVTSFHLCASIIIVKVTCQWHLSNDNSSSWVRPGPEAQGPVGCTGGGVLDPGRGKVMEEFLDSAWRGQRTKEERETLGERRRTPRGRSPILLPLDLVDFNKRKGECERESEWLLFRFSGRS